MDELQKYLGWPLEEVKAALGGQYTLRVKLTMPQRIRYYDARLKDLRVIRLRAVSYTHLDPHRGKGRLPGAGGKENHQPGGDELKFMGLSCII